LFGILYNRLFKWREFGILYNRLFKWRDRGTKASSKISKCR